MTVLDARPIGLEAIDDVIVANLKRKEKLPAELALLPEGEAWLLVEFGGETREQAAAAADDLRRRLGRRHGVRAAAAFTDPQEMAQVWLVRESALGATAFVPGET